MGVTHSLHVQALQQLSFVHEASKRESPAVSNGLKVLSLLDIDVDRVKASVLLSFSSGWLSNKALENTRGRLLSKNSLVLHMLENEVGRLLESLGAGVDFKLRTCGGFVGVRDASEILDLTSTSFLIETFYIS